MKSFNPRWGIDSNRLDPKGNNITKKGWLDFAHLRSMIDSEFLFEGGGTRQLCFWGQSHLLKKLF